MVASLQTHYSREIFRILTKIKQELTAFKNNPADTELLKQSHALIISITDLAMIHGYEGVEKIAGKLVTLFNNSISENKSSGQRFFTKVEAAINAIYQIAELEASAEDFMTIEYINRDAELSQTKIANCTTDLIEKFNDLDKKQLEIIFEDEMKVFADSKHSYQTEHQKSLIFEIKEYDAILELTDKFQRSTIDLFIAN